MLIQLRKAPGVKAGSVRLVMFAAIVALFTVLAFVTLYSFAALVPINNVLGLYGDTLKADGVPEIDADEIASAVAGELTSAFVQRQIALVELHEYKMFCPSS